ncbi:hypothetical protein CXF85_04300 [Colwellia sp. 75C3]|nr:hypothetical protein CXF85_04300 [Colwellia sp. 75C3]
MLLNFSLIYQFKDLNFLYKKRPIHSIFRRLVSKTHLDATIILLLAKVAHEFTEMFQFQQHENRGVPTSVELKLIS